MEGPAKSKELCSTLEIKSRPVLPNKRCCSWNNTDCRHICRFLFYREAEVFGERSSCINLLWSASDNHDNLFQKLVVTENTISVQPTKHISRKDFSYTLTVNMPLSHSFLHWGELAVVSTHFLVSCLLIVSIKSLWLTDMLALLFKTNKRCLNYTAAF